MITLSEAFRLCDIEDAEIVWLMNAGAETYGLFGGKHGVNARMIRNKTDMKKIEVHRISVQHDYDGDFCGMVFVVNGIPEEELIRLEYEYT